MATQGSGLAIDLVELSTRLLGQQEVLPRARILASAVVDLLPGSSACVYLLNEVEDSRVWLARATAGDISVAEAEVPVDQGTLGVLATEMEPLIFAGTSIAREEFSHLNVRRTVKSLGYLPIVYNESLIGAIEILAFETEITEANIVTLEPVAELAGGALSAAIAYEAERHNSLSSISRLTQLYDLEKVFSSTLELDKLLPIIASKFREVLACQAVNVWLLQGDESLLLMHQSGVDPTVHVGQSQKPGEGVPGDVSDDGEPVLIDSAEDDPLIRRNQGAQEGAIFSLMAAPLIDGGALVGVVEAINRMDGTPFDDDELFALTSLNETAVGALHNASLLMAERKVQILEALVKTSGEITSTLDLERVLQAVVNGPASVIPYERAAIALEQRGRIQLKAVAGIAELNADDPQFGLLNKILQWSAVLNEPLLVTQHGDEIDTDREETRAKFRDYFAETGMRAFHILPLADEEGRVGVLSFESSDPDFLLEAHLEMIKVLASQATVALRNASLYKEVPFIGVLQPIVAKKRRFLALEKHRRAMLIGAAAAAVLFVVAFPLPLRVDGAAVVVPARAAHLGSEFEGVVKQMNVREGDLVKKGNVLASLEDWDYRSALAAAEAKYETAVLQMDRALAMNDGTEAGIQGVQAEYWESEVARARERLDRSVIRSPIDGVIATPHLEDMVGRKLKFGDPLLDIVDNSQALVDVTIDEDDVTLLHMGERASVKLDGFPSRTFHGQVAIVSPQGRVEGDQRVFYARVRIPNEDGVVRSGMQGRGKIMTGWRPAGVVMFRRLAMWTWAKLWDWFGW